MSLSLHYYIEYKSAKGKWELLTTNSWYDYSNDKDEYVYCQDGHEHKALFTVQGIIRDVLYRRYGLTFEELPTDLSNALYTIKDDLANCKCIHIDKILSLAITKIEDMTAIMRKNVSDAKIDEIYKELQDIKSLIKGEVPIVSDSVSEYDKIDAYDEAKDSLYDWIFCFAWLNGIVLSVQHYTGEIIDAEDIRLIYYIA